MFVLGCLFAMVRISGARWTYQLMYAHMTEVFKTVKKSAESRTSSIRPESFLSVADLHLRFVNVE